MKKRTEPQAPGPTTWRLALLMATFGITACSDGDGPGDLNLDPIDELISQMTLEEKIAQMAGSGSGSAPYTVPGVERLGVPTFEMSDGPRGVQAVEGTTQL
ncbi:MAG: hypothetical protein JRI68_04720, partial [Deltaproteobacteria bacterium]|nr:hypothetical protein [Deltaproteobacteria bacterium]